MGKDREGKISEMGEKEREEGEGREGKW